MKFAVIGDIHGNKYALESVLADIKSKGIDTIYATGDLVGYLPYPNEVVELLRSNNIISIQGNHDKVISESKHVSQEEIEGCSMEDIQKSASKIFTNWCIKDENREFLKNLNHKINVELDGKSILIVHGSPKKIDEYLYDEEELLKKVAENISEDIIIFGHTHIPFVRKIGNQYFINAGSVGKPKHGDSRSTYVIVDIKNHEVTCVVEKVEYNLEQMVEDILNNPMISNDLVKCLKEGS